MKRQAVYYVAWDVIFILFLYLSTWMNQWVNDYVSRTLDIVSRFWIAPVIPILAGSLIAWLAWIGARYTVTLKSALLELILVGLPMLYIASLLYQYFFILPAIADVVHIRIPFWLMQENVFRIGGIAIGYEIFVFIARMIKLKSLKTPAEHPDPSGSPEQELSERETICNINETEI